MLPPKIKILGATYKIKAIKNLKSDDGQDCHGLCDPLKKLISVRKEADTKIMIGTLYHEIMHALIYEAGLRFCPSWNTDLEEIVCNALEKFMVEN